jgi:sec-independent protein translocase protein TatB
MLGLSFSEILIILVLALILLGPRRLPEVAKQLGKGLREFKKATDDLKQQFESELYSEETRAAPRPSLVPPTPASPISSERPVMPASLENVPGLEAATAEPAKPAPPALTTPTAPVAADPSEAPKSP